ncbi:hypothetical protein LCGC14_1584960 [marine sediment metagenome]|uniref:Uncharacterized protein n=1 Tax=marine sediment metagenome TaxID=412755 RepID=A0A0F9KWD2_9ZZZZ
MIFDESTITSEANRLMNKQNENSKDVCNNKKEYYRNLSIEIYDKYLKDV